MWNAVSRKIAQCIFVLGALGFLQPFWLGLLPTELLRRVELPNTLNAARVTAPNGRVFVASTPFGRVQRYGPDGFERAFYVDSRGGVFDIGVTPAGEILICSVRARALITYNQDGVETGERQTCDWKDANRGIIPSATVYYAPNAKVPAVAFSWLSALAVPLWHPMLAWLMVMVAGLYLKSRSPKP